jgi:hypothetical protein
MKAQFQFLIFFSVIIFTTHSCSVYTPNALNTPLLKEKGDFELGAHIGNGTNLQAAYAIGNHLGVITNYAGTESEVSINDDNTKRRGSMYELGFGYFSKKPDSKIIYEIYGGAGVGNVSIEKKLSNATAYSIFKTSTSKFFIQPAIGSVRKNFEISFATRMSVAQYRKINTTYSDAELRSDNLYNLEQPCWMYVEPALTLRLGVENLKFQMQVGRSFKLSKQDIDHRASIFNCGLIAKI